MGGPSLSAAASSLSSLLAVLLLLAGAAWLARRLRARLPGAAGGKTQGAISILSSRPLGGQNALIIAEVEGARFLIGVSRAGLHCIGRLSAPEEPPP